MYKTLVNGTLRRLIQSFSHCVFLIPAISFLSIPAISFGYTCIPYFSRTTSLFTSRYDAKQNKCFDTLSTGGSRQEKIKATVHSES